MAQLLLPLFHKGSIEIGNNMYYKKENGRVTYFQGIMPFFHHAEEDLQSFRLAVSLLAETCNVKQIRISQVFGISYIFVKRCVKVLREHGPKGFFQDKKGRSPHILTEKVITKAQKLLDSGLNCNEVAEQLKIKPATVRKAIQQGKLHRPNLNKETPEIKEKSIKPTTKSERNLEDSRASLGLGCTNDLERIMAAKGQLKAVEPSFTKSSDVQSAGVLVALPALLANGLLKYTEKYFRLPDGYYGIETIFITLAFAALLRIKSIEGVRYCDPGEFGKIVGIVRIPEVKTLREKFEILSNNGNTKEWSSDLAILWMEETPELSGTLYIDGHVRPYHGKQTKLPKRYVSREKLCLRGVTDYWINDAIGQPFFVVTKEVNSGLLSVLREDIIPRLLQDVPNQPTTEDLKENKTIYRFGIVFDREGYSPEFMKEMWKNRIVCYTYKKFVKDLWDENEFTEQEVIFPNGEKSKMKIAEKIISHPSKQTFREIRKLSKRGHQTVIITTDFYNKVTVIAGTMFSRWSQENFFKYMMKEYGIDALIDYETVKIDDPEIQVKNPEYKVIDSKIRTINGKQSRKKIEYAEIELSDEIDEEKMKDYVQKKASLKEEIDKMEEEKENLKIKRKETGKYIEFKDLPEEEQYKRFKGDRKHLIDTIKMIAYRAETALVIIAREYLSKNDIARSFVKQLLKTDADLTPNYETNELVVTIHNMTNPVQNHVVSKLCQELNDTETIFPCTNLRMIFNTVST